MSSCVLPPESSRRETLQRRLSYSLTEILRASELSLPPRGLSDIDSRNLNYQAVLWLNLYVSFAFQKFLQQSNLLILLF
jgi:hypothetical protein